MTRVFRPATYARPPLADAVGPPPMPPGCVYTLKQAARMAQVTRATVQGWITGKARVSGVLRRTTRVIRYAPVWIDGAPCLTFPQLLSLRMVKGLRHSGFTLRVIGWMALVAEEDFGLTAPLVALRFRRDGARIVQALQEARRANAEPEHLPSGLDPSDAAGWQTVFADIVDRALFRDVDWRDGMPARWWPLGHEGAVVLDPHVLAGAPHMAGTTVPTAAVAAGGGAEDAIGAVAERHGLTVAQVRDALRFETEGPIADHQRGPVRSDSSPPDPAASAPRWRPARSRAA
jgi:uncharacterized protein (DUF433 family)